jgi:hypothetical protein
VLRSRDPAGSVLADELGAAARRRAVLGELGRARVAFRFFILEGLVVPHLDDGDLAAVAASAARLSCADERFAELAGAVGVEVGPLPGDERERLRVEIDARVARAWSLTAEDLDVLLADLTLDAVPPGHRRRLAERLAELYGSGSPGRPAP